MGEIGETEDLDSAEHSDQLEFFDSHAYWDQRGFWNDRQADLHAFFDEAPARLDVGDAYLLWVEHAGPLHQLDWAERELETVMEIRPDLFGASPIWDPRSRPWETPYRYTRTVPEAGSRIRPMSRANHPWPLHLSSLVWSAAVTNLWTWVIFLPFIVGGMGVWGWLLDRVPNSWNALVKIGAFVALVPVAFGLVAAIGYVLVSPFDPLIERVEWPYDAWRSYSPYLTGSELIEVIDAGRKDGTRLAREILRYDPDSK